MISAEVAIQAQFYDLDPMNVVWHGNYVRYLEQARCALLDRIGYNYPDMQASGFIWPIVDMNLKYVRPVRFGQVIIVQATLVEYENRMKIDYRIRDQATGELLTKARTVQLAVSAETGELSFDSPPALIEKVRRLL
ncbi:acyl-CoA thioesterase [Azospirillum sp. SYSU D00513]|uniref:acyl-CoA thioesterase n=1 Tax=Azospirillum sp. SYSU D00513 TaxID=2812561 RepID=UPI001A96D1AD|nr:acyl-CoA thioesterase [Azospirillum sp. SYSU D00513]